MQQVFVFVYQVNNKKRGKVKEEERDMLKEPALFAAAKREERKLRSLGL